MASLDVKGKGKLGPKFFDPFQITERVGSVAYRLQLLVSAKLHDVFHVGLLKCYYDEPRDGPGVLPPTRHGRACVEPAKVIKSRLSRGRHELLVAWKGLEAANSSWMDLAEFKLLYSAFQLEDELIVQGGRDVMWGTPYVRRRKSKAEPCTGAATKEGGGQLALAPRVSTVSSGC
jgi:hypothetical protein